MNRVTKLLCCIFFFNLFTLSAYAQDVVFQGETDGQLLLTVYEYDIKKKEAVKRAMADAFYNIFFRGIPQSTMCHDALMGTEVRVKDNRTQYYDQLVSTNRMASFVTYCNLSNYKKKTAEVELTINISALISDMRQNNLYRKFGFK